MIKSFNYKAINYQFIEDENTSVNEDRKAFEAMIDAMPTNEYLMIRVNQELSNIFPTK